MKVTGTVHHVSPSGYGFIRRDDGTGDVFVHARAVGGIGYRVAR